VTSKFEEELETFRLDLPENKELAFGIFVQRARVLLGSIEFENSIVKRQFEGVVADYTIGLIQGLSIDIPVAPRPTSTESTSFDNWFQVFWSIANMYAVRYRTEHSFGGSTDVITAIAFSEGYKNRNRSITESG
jgi:hypothetical protein